MIDILESLDDISARMALWCTATSDDAGLAALAEFIASNNIGMVSVRPDDVMQLWAWLEGRDCRIMARFYLPPRAARDECAISDLTQSINSAFKQGAAGAQIFLRASDIDDFARQIANVREDLFFNKDLIIGLDINDIDVDAWAHVLGVVQDMRANALLLVVTRDGGMRSDFVGRFYAAMGAWENINCDLHFMPGQNLMRIEQAARLVDIMQPKLAPKMRVFVNSLNLNITGW